MPRLNAVIAALPQVQTSAEKELTRLHHMFEKQGLLSGQTRTYEPNAEDGERYPDENQEVQVKVWEAIREIEAAVVSHFDARATQEYGNVEANADVKVDGVVILKDVPVTYLLFLEKALVNIHTFIAKLPVLDMADRWTFDPKSDAYTTGEVFTNKTKKVPRAFVKAEATEKHPAQVEVFQEDVVVGKWRLVKFSGGLERRRINDMRERVEQLQIAVKQAREEANTREVDQRKVGKTVLDYIFGKSLTPTA